MGFAEHRREALRAAGDAWFEASVLSRRDMAAKHIVGAFLARLRTPEAVKDAAYELGMSAVDVGDVLAVLAGDDE